MKNHDSIGVQIPKVWLPKVGIDPQKWAVIACDQYTSQPDYWHEVENFVGSAPSTLHLTFPEVYLERPGAEQRIQNIQSNMRQYLAEGLLTPNEGMVYVERYVSGKLRRGLLLALDLERYDYTQGAQSLVRATEGTIIERLPPRMRIRQGAALELPHILVLIDDPKRTVIEPLGKVRDRLPKLYDFDLMLDSGHLQGWLVNESTLETQAIQALEALANPITFAQKYGVGADQPVLLFAMGDGNHSLATAKAVWERIKPQVGMDHPARFALVEIENVHDEGLEFEPIHRVLFGIKREIIPAMQAWYGTNLSIKPCKDLEEMLTRVDNAAGKKPQIIGLINTQGYYLASVTDPTFNLPVGTLQVFLDSFLKEGGAEKIDYVHGTQVISRLGILPGNFSFYLPGMHKNDLFKTVILDGALPRKTFSMGEAQEKRFYMECRQIS